MACSLEDQLSGSPGRALDFVVLVSSQVVPRRTTALWLTLLVHMPSAEKVWAQFPRELCPHLASRLSASIQLGGLSSSGTFLLGSAGPPHPPLPSSLGRGVGCRDLPSGLFLPPPGSGQGSVSWTVLAACHHQVAKSSSPQKQTGNGLPWL